MSDRVPDSFDPIIAYRAWRVSKGGLIHGLAQRAPWPPYAPMEARCSGGISPLASHYEPNERNPHLDAADEYIPPPALRCTCGIYAFKTLPDVAIIREEYRGQPFVWGEVKLWGRVIECHLGYRAEFAYPGELSASQRYVVDYVAKRYGVPVRLLETEEDEAEPDADGIATLTWQRLSSAMRYLGTPPPISMPIYSPVTYAPPEATRSAPPAGLVWTPPPGYTPDIHRELYNRICAILGRSMGRHGLIRRRPTHRECAELFEAIVKRASR